MILRLFFIFSLAVAALILSARPSIATENTLELKYTHFTSPAQRQIDCLAENIYFESAYEPRDGRVAVALVTLNRVQDPRYPNNICGVVKQKTRITTIENKRIVCQFSWYCEENKFVRNRKAYQEALDIAIHVYANYEKLYDLTHGALFYHADYVSLRKIGVRGLEKTTKIGRHIFYKER